MLELYSLASGSKGNCTILKFKDTYIVIDCGCTKKYLVSRFKELNISIDQIHCLLVTHTHSDHISSISLFKDKKKYAGSTLDENTEIIVNKSPIIINDINILPIALSHDCPNTYGFIITYNNEKLVYITDTGYVKEEYIEILDNPDYIILESNHDVEMLMNTDRPHFLKQRIFNDTGHLCNEDASNIINKIVGNNTKLIWLAHLSEQANTSIKALEVLNNTIDTTNINVQCLKQYEVTIWKKRQIH